MAHIKSFPFIKHLRADASRHVLAYRHGRNTASGRGLSMWFSPMSTSLVEIPVDDRELPFMFHARSSDYQDVSVQGVINLRVQDPETLSDHIDFSLDCKTGDYAQQPLERLMTLTTELAQQFASDYLTHHRLEEILENGFEAIRARIKQGLDNDSGISGIGLSIISVRIVAVRPANDVEKALQTPAREVIQQRSDQATFERRALAVEKERAIAENELQNQIELARREESLIERRGDNERRRVTDEADARRIEAQAKAQRTDIMSRAEAGRIEATEHAKTQAEASRMAIYRDYPQQVLMALAAQTLASNPPAIEHLNVSPDLVAEFLNRFVTQANGAAGA